MRYHLFSGDNYYPHGGMADYRGAFSTIQETELAFSKPREGYKGAWDWGQIASDDGITIQPILLYPREDNPYIGWGPWVDDE